MKKNRKTEVFISYSHDSDEHCAIVLEIAKKLQLHEGLNCEIDQNHPTAEWPSWSQTYIEQADFILVVCTEMYYRKAMNKAKSREGTGVGWEIKIIQNLIHDNPAEWEEKVIPVLLDQADRIYIPPALLGTTRYVISNVKDYEKLFKLLTNQSTLTDSENSNYAREALPPYRSLPYFFGREDLLTRLHSAFRNQTTPKRQPLALSGIPGIGKTTIALEYAHKYSKEYRYIFWVRAETITSLETGYIGIARTLGFIEDDSAKYCVKEVVKEVKAWLERHHNWLLIIDNADMPKLIREFLPAVNKGDILLTSRDRIFGDLAERIEIERLSDNQGALFLLRRAGIITMNDPLDMVLQSDIETALELCNKMEGIPLLLDQAGAYMEEFGKSVRECLQEYMERGENLRNRRGDIYRSGDDGEYGGCHPALTQTYSMLFDKIKHDTVATDIVRLCAFLAPSETPLQLLMLDQYSPTHKGIGLNPLKTFRAIFQTLSYFLRQKIKPQDFDEAIRTTTKLSLTKHNHNTESLNMNLAVKEVIKDLMSPNTQQRWAERAVCALSETFICAAFANHRKLCERLLEQTEAASSLIEKYDFKFIQATNLFEIAGQFCTQQGHYSDAERYFHKALAIVRKVTFSRYFILALSYQYSITSGIQDRLGLVYVQQGKYIEAEAAFRESLSTALLTRLYRPPEYAILLNNLALLYISLGRYAEAETLLLRSIRIIRIFSRIGFIKSAFQVRSSELPVMLSNLLVVYVRQRKFVQATELAQRLWACLGSEITELDPRYATILNSLALLYKKQDRLAEAEGLYQKARENIEQINPGHPFLATILGNLAMVCFAKKNYDEAEALCQQAIQHGEEKLGLEHPDLIELLLNLQFIYEAQNRSAEAQAFYERAKHIADKVGYYKDLNW